MGAFGQLSWRKFFIKLRSWEYWPFGIVQAPALLYYPYLSMRAGSLFFFSASNPGILMGGMFGESKFDVLQLVPEGVKPRTILQKVPATTAEIAESMAAAGMTFPVIFKPDLGERGWMVRRISNDREAAAYLDQIRIDFLIQEYADLPLEFGVFYVRYPREAHGRVTSLVEKEMLSVTGDGSATLRELILANDRAVLQSEVLEQSFGPRLDSVPAAGEKIELVSVGNHCLGTKFLDAGARITPKLTRSFDEISLKIPEFYFGRFDLRAASYSDLESGRVMIVELNGCGAEPAHIYQPGFPFLKAVRILLRHWRDIYTISRENHARGIPYLSFRDGKSIYSKFRSLKS